MPKKLDSFVFPHGGRKGIEFDWDSILDGSVWELKQGTDFTDEPKKFANAAARVANQRGLRVRRQIDGKTLTMQAVPKGSDEAPATA